jgi:hypothetical protein
VAVSAADGDPIVVDGKPGLRSMQAHLLSGEREQPVIALTWSVDAEEPVLAPEDVRAIVGPGPRIYLIQAEYLLRRLQGALGPLALPRGSARVWWPGISVGSDPGEHPLVLALDGEPQASMCVELARQFDLSRPHVRREIELIEDTRRLAEHQLAQAVEQNRTTEEHLRDVQIERHQALTRAQAAEASLDAATDPLGEMGCEERLHSLITREWVQALTASDRREHPLGAYVLTGELVATVEHQASLPQERLAWVCAMLACGYAPALAGLATHPLLSGRAGGQLQRADGAKGWRCSLKRNASGGPRLHYWIRPDGTIEFAEVGSHDQLKAQ